jgi:hypothetical protein
MRCKWYLWLSISNTFFFLSCKCQLPPIFQLHHPNLQILYSYYIICHIFIKPFTLCYNHIFVCLFCFESHEQCFSYLATVTITDDGAAILDLCLALTAFSSEGSFTCHTYCDTGPPFLRSYPKDPSFYLLNAVLLAKKQSLPILKRLRFDAAGPSGARTHDLPFAKREHYH